MPCVWLIVWERTITDKSVADLFHQITYPSLIGTCMPRNTIYFCAQLAVAILARYSITKFNFYMSVAKNRL